MKLHQNMQIGLDWFIVMMNLNVKEYLEIRSPLNALKYIHTPEMASVLLEIVNIITLIVLLLEMNVHLEQFQENAILIQLNVIMPHF